MPLSTSSSKWARLFMGVYAALIAGALAGIVAFTTYADPYALHSDPATRPLTPLHLRLWKPMRQGHDDVVILGSSRALDGIRPEDFPVPGRRVFNAGIGGMTLWEEAAMLKHAYYANGVTDALLTIDLFALNAGKPFSKDFAHGRLRSARLSPPFYWKDMVEASVTLSAVTDAWHTIRGGIEADEVIHRDGFADVPGWPAIIAAHGYEDEFQKAENGYIENTWWDDDGHFEFEKGDVSAFETFRDIVDFAYDHNIRLTVAFSPVHARMLCAMDAAGLWPALETAKRRLLAITLDEAAARHAPAFSVWDFADFSGPTTESLPIRPGALMRYYREASHYTPALGRMMMERIYAHGPSGFGERLAPDALDDHLAAVSSRKAAYLKVHTDFKAGLERRVSEQCPCRYHGHFIPSPRVFR